MENADSVTSNWALLPRIISDHQGYAMALEREKPKTEISVLQPDVLFVLTRAFSPALSHICWSEIHCRQLCYLSTCEQDNILQTSGDKDHPQLQRGLIVCFKLRIWTLRFTKNFIEKTASGKIQCSVTIFLKENMTSLKEVLIAHLTW